MSRCLLELDWKSRCGFELALVSLPQQNGAEKQGCAPAREEGSTEEEGEEEQEERRDM